MAKKIELTGQPMYWLFGLVVLLLASGMVYLIISGRQKVPTVDVATLQQRQGEAATRTPIEWQDFANAEEFYSVKMPATPTHLADELTVSGQAIATSVYYAPHDTDQYVVRTGKLATAPNGDDLSDFLVATAVAQGTISETISGNYVAHQGYPAYDYVIRDVSANLYHAGRVIINNDQLYIADVISPDKEGAEVTTFRESLTIDQLANFSYVQDEEEIPADAIFLTPEEAVKMGLPNAATPEDVAAAQAAGESATTESATGVTPKATPVASPVTNVP
ncbi:hypothetical protein IJJ12_02545 [bacterium]|nr:hypothetical protein [bacterium]